MTDTGPSNTDRYVMIVVNPACVVIDDTDRLGAPWQQRVAVLQGADALKRATGELERIKNLPDTVTVQMCAAKLDGNAPCSRACRFLSGAEAITKDVGRYSGWYHLDSTLDGHWAVPASMVR